MAKYRLTPAAKNDLLEIWEYTIKAWGSKKAKQYLFDIETKLEMFLEANGCLIYGEILNAHAFISLMRDKAKKGEFIAIINEAE